MWQHTSLVISWRSKTLSCHLWVFEHWQRAIERESRVTLCSFHVTFPLQELEIMQLTKVLFTQTKQKSLSSHFNTDTNPAGQDTVLIIIIAILLGNKNEWVRNTDVVSVEAIGVVWAFTYIFVFVLMFFLFLWLLMWGGALRVKKERFMKGEDVLLRQTFLTANQNSSFLQAIR